MSGLIRVDTGSAGLAVEVAGNGPVLLLVHGFPLDRAMWRHQLAAPEGWTRVAPDLRGAGASDVPRDGYSMTRYADDLVAVLDAMQTPQAVCCGLSMGGYIVFEMMRRHAKRIRALILCDTKSEADTPEGKRGRDELALVARRDGIDAVAARLMPKLVGRTTSAEHPAIVEEVRAMVLRSPIDGVVGALEAMRDRPDSTPSLSALRVPTLVVGGVEDELTPSSVVRAIADRTPGARYVEIVASGHITPLERPAAFNSAVAEFLAQLS